jgi:hypothetical protein
VRCETHGSDGLQCNLCQLTWSTLPCSWFVSQFDQQQDWRCRGSCSCESTGDTRRRRYGELRVSAHVTFRIRTSVMVCMNISCASSCSLLYCGYHQCSLWILISLLFRAEILNCVSTHKPWGCRHPCTSQATLKSWRFSVSSAGPLTRSAGLVLDAPPIGYYHRPKRPEPCRSCHLHRPRFQRVATRAIAQIRTGRRMQIRCCPQRNLPAPPRTPPFPKSHRQSKRSRSLSRSQSRSRRQLQCQASFFSVQIKVCGMDPSPTSTAPDLGACVCLPFFHSRLKCHS